MGFCLWGCTELDMTDATQQQQQQQQQQGDRDSDLGAVDPFPQKLTLRDRLSCGAW